MGIPVTDKEYDLTTDGHHNAPYGSEASDNIIIRRSLLDLWVPILGLFLSLALIVYFADVAPYSIRNIAIELFGRSFLLHIPVLGIIPLVLLARIARGLLNEKYILTPEYILAISGSFTFNTRTIRLRYAHIKDVEMNKTPHQQLFDLADLYFSTSIRHGDDTLHLKGVRHPRAIKDLVQERITKAIFAARGQITPPAQPQDKRSAQV